MHRCPVLVSGDQPAGLGVGGVDEHRRVRGAYVRVLGMVAQKLDQPPLGAGMEVGAARTRRIVALSVSDGLRATRPSLANRPLSADDCL